MVGEIVALCYLHDMEDGSLQGRKLTWWNKAFPAWVYKRKALQCSVDGFHCYLSGEVNIRRQKQVFSGVAVVVERLKKRVKHRASANSWESNGDQ